jgi:hypothetical protein
MHPEERDELNRRASAAGMSLQLYLRQTLGFPPKADRQQAREQIANQHSSEGTHGDSAQNDSAQNDSAQNDSAQNDSAQKTAASEAETQPQQDCQGHCPPCQMPCV